MKKLSKNGSAGCVPQAWMENTKKGKRKTEGAKHADACTDLSNRVLGFYGQ